MFSKFTTNVATMQPKIHRIPAGMMKGDMATEMFACQDTGNVFAISNGHTIPFKDLDPELRGQLLEKLYADPVAFKDLKHLPLEEAVEQFAHCIYGAADSNPDFCDNGILKAADNFICSNSCVCLKWNSKNITINSSRLTLREIEIIKLLATDMPDKAIADNLGISVSTLDTHKKNLFQKAGVSSKHGLIVEAIKEKIIQ